MIKLGKLRLSTTPRIVVSFKDGTSSTVVAAAKKLGLDIAELRIDQYSSFEKRDVLSQIAKFRALPTLATIRSKKEGGAWSLSEAQRLDLFKTIMTRVDAVDIELSSTQILPEVVKAARKAKKRVIISYHNFERTPDAKSLSKTLKKAKALGADIVKIATMSLREKDIQTLAAFTIANASKNLITIAMGSQASASRVFFPMLGSLMTYAYLGKPTAPGQLRYDETFQYLSRFYPSFIQEKKKSCRFFKSI